MDPTAPLRPPRPLGLRAAGLAVAVLLHLAAAGVFHFGFAPAAVQPVSPLLTVTPVTWVRVVEPQTPPDLAPASPPAPTARPAAPAEAPRLPPAPAVTPPSPIPPVSAPVARPALTPPVAAPPMPLGDLVVARAVPTVEAAPYPPSPPPSPSSSPSAWPAAASPADGAAATVGATVAREAGAAATGVFTDSPAGATAGLPAEPPGRAATPARLDMLACPQPTYPAAARRAHAEGTTRIRFQVSATGAVERAEVERSAGSSREHRLLDQAAVSALAVCRFQPGTDEAGHPVGAVARVDYVWRLE